MSDGYWNPFRMSLWAAMSPADRDYDRYVGKYPPGQGQCETEGGREAIEQRDGEGERGCSCHVNPPCDYCVDSSNEEEDDG